MIDGVKLEEGRAIPADRNVVGHEKHVTNPYKTRTSKAYFRPRKTLLAIWLNATPCISDSERDNCEDNLEACISCSAATKTINTNTATKVAKVTDKSLFPCLSGPPGSELMY
jgi:hypothetical protein